jgi:hypothetical protein
VCVCARARARCATGPPASVQLDALDHGVDQGPSWSLGQLGGDQPNILPLDLNLTLNFTLYLFLLPFHHRSVHRACLIVTVNRR